jgi:hypothetical protein
MQDLVVTQVLHQARGERWPGSLLKKRAVPGTGSVVVIVSLPRKASTGGDSNRRWVLSPTPNQHQPQEEAR